MVLLRYAGMLKRAKESGVCRYVSGVRKRQSCNEKCQMCKEVLGI